MQSSELISDFYFCSDKLVRMESVQYISNKLSCRDTFIKFQIYYYNYMVKNIKMRSSELKSVFLGPIYMLQYTLQLYLTLKFMKNTTCFSIEYFNACIKMILTGTNLLVT